MSIRDLQQAFSDLVTNRYYGKFAGVVVDVDDPKKIGRLRAKVPLFRLPSLTLSRPSPGSRKMLNWFRSTRSRPL